MSPHHRQQLSPPLSPTDDYSPPPAYELSQQEVDAKLSRAVEQGLNLNGNSTTRRNGTSGSRPLPDTNRAESRSHFPSPSSSGLPVQYERGHQRHFPLQVEPLNIRKKNLAKKDEKYDAPYGIDSQGTRNGLGPTQDRRLSSNQTRSNLPEAPPSFDSVVTSYESSPSLSRGHQNTQNGFRPGYPRSDASSPPPSPPDSRFPRHNRTASSSYGSSYHDNLAPSAMGYHSSSRVPRAPSMDSRSLSSSTSRTDNLSVYSRRSEEEPAPIHQNPAELYNSAVAAHLAPSSYRSPRDSTTSKQYSHSSRLSIDDTHSMRSSIRSVSPQPPRPQPSRHTTKYSADDTASVRTSSSSRSLQPPPPGAMSPRHPSVPHGYAQISPGYPHQNPGSGGIDPRQPRWATSQTQIFHDVHRR